MPTRISYLHGINDPKEGVGFFIPPGVLELGKVAVDLVVKLITGNRAARENAALMEILPEWVEHGIRLWRGEFSKVTHIWPVEPPEIYPVEWITQTVLDNFKDWDKMEMLIKNRGTEDGKKYLAGELKLSIIKPSNGDPLEAGGTNTVLMLLLGLGVAGYFIFKR